MQKSLQQLIREFDDKVLLIVDSWPMRGKHTIIADRLMVSRQGFQEHFLKKLRQGEFIAWAPVLSLMYESNMSRADIEKAKEEYNVIWQQIKAQRSKTTSEMRALRRQEELVEA